MLFSLPHFKGAKCLQIYRSFNHNRHHSGYKGAFATLSFPAPCTNLKHHPHDALDGNLLPSGMGFQVKGVCS